MESPVLTTQKKLLQINEVKTQNLYIADFSINKGECWAVLGPNGSGKLLLGQLIAGALLPTKGNVERMFNHCEQLSFESQQKFYEQELKQDDSEFMEGSDIGTTVAALLGLPQPPESLHFLRLDNIWKRGYRQLSSGEARKVLLVQALQKKPDLLILDEPFDSLDAHTLEHLQEYLGTLAVASKTKAPSLLFFLNNLNDLQSWHTHLAVLAHGEMIACGSKESVLNNPNIIGLLEFNAKELPDFPPSLTVTEEKTFEGPLVELINGRVAYGDEVIFKELSLRIMQGQHTLVTGPNGSGKSTLLGLLTGDHPQCYSNNLAMFGRRRGTGETIWDLKKNIGIVSSNLHRDHRVSGSALEITLSGFHDTIGLYDSVTPEQIEHAKIWLALTGMHQRMNTPFKYLSYGEQRLILIARALVKQPNLIVLDEPTQGLDTINRARLLYFVNHLATQARTTVIMVSHREDEFLPLFTQHIDLSSCIGVS